GRRGGGTWGGGGGAGGWGEEGRTSSRWSDWRIVRRRVELPASSFRIVRFNSCRSTFSRGRTCATKSSSCPTREIWLPEDSVRKVSRLSRTSDKSVPSGGSGSGRKSDATIERRYHASGVSAARVWNGRGNPG